MSSTIKIQFDSHNLIVIQILSIQKGESIKSYLIFFSISVTVAEVPPSLLNSFFLFYNQINFIISHLEMLWKKCHGEQCRLQSTVATFTAVPHVSLLT